MHDETSKDRERAFRTSAGICRVRDDCIELERTGLKGWLASTLIGDSIGRAVLWYGVAGLGLVGWGLYDLLVLETNLGWLPLTFGVIALLNVALSRDASAATEIPRDAIERVVPEAPILPLRRGHFMIHFRDDGELRRRVIMLPGLLSGGSDEYERALELLEGEGLVESEDD